VITWLILLPRLLPELLPVLLLILLLLPLLPGLLSWQRCHRSLQVLGAEGPAQ